VTARSIHVEVADELRTIILVAVEGGWKQALTSGQGTGKLDETRFHEEFRVSRLRR